MSTCVLIFISFRLPFAAQIPTGGKDLEAVEKGHLAHNPPGPCARLPKPFGGGTTDRRNLATELIECHALLRVFDCFLFPLAHNSRNGTRRYKHIMLLCRHGNKSSLQKRGNNNTNSSIQKKNPHKANGACHKINNGKKNLKREIFPPPLLPLFWPLAVVPVRVCR